MTSQGVRSDLVVVNVWNRHSSERHGFTVCVSLHIGMIVVEDLTCGEGKGEREPMIIGLGFALLALPAITLECLRWK